MKLKNNIKTWRSQSHFGRIVLLYCITISFKTKTISSNVNLQRMVLTIVMHFSYNCTESIQDNSLKSRWIQFSIREGTYTFLFLFRQKGSGCLLPLLWADIRPWPRCSIKVSEKNNIFGSFSLSRPTIVFLYYSKVLV